MFFLDSSWQTEYFLLNLTWITRLLSKIWIQAFYFCVLVRMYTINLLTDITDMWPMWREVIRWSVNNRHIDLLGNIFPYTCTGVVGQDSTGAEIWLWILGLRNSKELSKYFYGQHPLNKRFCILTYSICTLKHFILFCQSSRFVERMLFWPASYALSNCVNSLVPS